MATTAPLSLVTDPSKINPVGAQQKDLEEYQKSLESQITALEQRYNQPNWFNVAAGFAKPQLGGFFASLGSASQALGETEEKRRESQLPIAQMRTQLAQSKILTGANKTQADEYEAWRASGKPMDQATFTRLFSLNPQTPVAEAIKAAYEGQRKDLEFTSSQQRLMMDAIQMKQAKGMKLSVAEQNFLENLPGQLSQRQEAQSLLPGGKPTGAEGPAAAPAPPKETSNAPVGMFDLSAPGALESVRKGIALMTDPDQRARATQALESQLNPNRPAQEAKPERPKTYPPTIKYPNLAGLPDDERKTEDEKYRSNTANREAKSDSIVNQWRTLAEETTYGVVDGEYRAAIGLLNDHPDVAKKVFNLLRGKGDLANQFASAAQEGFGLNFNGMSANLNLPVNAFLNSGLNPEQQILADRLVKAMLIVGNAKLQSQGITPDKGAVAYQQMFDGTKASLRQNPATAFLNLSKDYVTFKQNKALYDQVMKEFPLQSATNTATPYTDILNNSEYLKDINKKAKEDGEKLERLHSEAIRNMKEKRKSAEKGKKP
jgi:hypothetical protein